MEGLNTKLQDQCPNHSVTLLPLHVWQHCGLFCLIWLFIVAYYFFFFREYFLETLNTCGYNYQVHTGILILYNGKLTSRVLIHLQS